MGTNINRTLDFALLIPSKGRFKKMIRMLNSVYNAAPDLEWEAQILCDYNEDEIRFLKGKFKNLKVYNECDYFQNRPSWGEMVQFLLENTDAKYFMYCSDDIVFTKNSIKIALTELSKWSGLAAGVAMSYLNVNAYDCRWKEYGIDLTLGDNILVNYGFFNTAIVKKFKGLSNIYRFYCADGDLCLTLLQNGYKIIPCIDACVIHYNIEDQMKIDNLSTAEADIELYKKRWTKFFYDISFVKRINAKSPEPDALLPSGKLMPVQLCESGVPIIQAEQDALYVLYATGLYFPTKRLRLHLGCGEVYLQGYVNIDLPDCKHSVMKPKVDVYGDIRQLRFPANSIDEVRLHHVFEHFNRIEALGLLIRWHRWLKVGGILHLEVPDLKGIAETILAPVPLSIKLAAVRHLTGDQTDNWAYHLDHWFSERIIFTLQKLGFSIRSISSTRWSYAPYLPNLEVIASKDKDIPTQELYIRAVKLLTSFILSENELKNLKCWQQKLKNFLSYK
ncbi:MAG: methyltransferase domain-containing protein [candidate division WOR-3 bacterium]